jgi:hypothetical protein
MHANLYDVHQGALIDAFSGAQVVLCMIAHIVMGVQVVLCMMYDVHQGALMDAFSGAQLVVSCVMIIVLKPHLLLHVVCVLAVG